MVSTIIQQYIVENPMGITYLPLQDSETHALVCESLLYVSRDWLREVSYETQQMQHHKKYFFEAFCRGVEFRCLK